MQKIRNDVNVEAAHTHTNILESKVKKYIEKRLLNL